MLQRDTTPACQPRQGWFSWFSCQVQLSSTGTRTDERIRLKTGRVAQVRARDRFTKLNIATECVTAVSPTASRVAGDPPSNARVGRDSSAAGDPAG
jgi:hypothetical protein